MSDDLAVGSSTTTVLTTELEQRAGTFWQLHRELDECRHRLFVIDRLVDDPAIRAADAPQSTLRAEWALDEAAVHLARAADGAAFIARALRLAATGYDLAERGTERIGQELAAEFAYSVGFSLPVLAVLLLPGAIVSSLVAGGTLLAMTEGQRAELFRALGGWLQANSGALSDPGVVELVRMAVMSSDDVAGGTLKLPPGLVRLLGDDGLGITGVGTSAAVLAALAGPAGLLKETGVSVRVTGSATGVPDARGIKDRVDRIPPEPEQIRIDRYSRQGEPDRFEVYLAGTAELGVQSGGNPWDMTSNVAAMADGPLADDRGAASYRAAVQAMREAGIDADSPVTITGYSQGGLIAAQLAASGDYAVDGLVTFGAPAGPVDVPRDIPYLALEHSNDLVPALGGRFVHSDPVVVTRRVFDAAPPPSDIVLPAHQLTLYRETAGLVDGSDNRRLAAVLARLQHPPADSVSSTMYLASREP